MGPGWDDASDPKTKRRQLDNPSDFVRIEIGEALARGIPVVPVLLDGAAMPDVDTLPDDLKELVDRQAEFVEYRTFETDVERLIRKLRLTSDKGTDEPAMPRPSSPTPQQAPVSASSSSLAPEPAKSPDFAAAGSSASVSQNPNGTALRNEMVPGSSKSRGPTVIAAVFALASFASFPGALLWDQPVKLLDLAWINSITITILIVGGLVLLRRRRGKITGIEIALYWLGFSWALGVELATLAELVGWQGAKGPSWER